MDIRIKGPRDGIETAEIFKKRFDLPVIYLTAYADESTIARAKMTEPYGYLLKPVKSAELQCTIEVSLFKHPRIGGSAVRSRSDGTHCIRSPDLLAAGSGDTGSG
jgi:AmiR/NasT family two-component response regulator